MRILYEGKDYVTNASAEGNNSNGTRGLAEKLVTKFNEDELTRLAERRAEQTRFWSSTMMGGGEWEKQADAFADDGY